MPEGFLSLIVTMLPAFQEIEQRLDRETGRRFNAFKLFAPNELATSRILAFLLDPTEAKPPVRLLHSLLQSDGHH
jgi:hypothetical protein